MDHKSAVLPVLLALVMMQGCASNTPKTSQLPSVGKAAAQNKDEQFSLKPYLQEAALKSSSSHEYEEAATYWFALYQQNPGDKNAALQAAYNMRYANSPADAINVINDALKTHAGDAQLLAERGKAYAAGGNADLALQDITAASASDAADWSVHSALGVILDRLDRHDEARLAYEKALTLSPDNPAALNNLALNQALSGRHEEAIATLQRASQRPAATVQIRQNLSLLLAMHGDVRQASDISQADLPDKLAKNNMRYYAGLTLE